MIRGGPNPKPKPNVRNHRTPLNDKHIVKSCETCDQVGCDVVLAVDHEGSEHNSRLVDQCYANDFSLWNPENDAGMNEHQKQMIETLTQHHEEPIPHWVTHIGQDEDGMISGFNYQPQKSGNKMAGGFWERDFRYWQIPVTLILDLPDNPNWDQTLVAVTVTTVCDYKDVQ